MVFAQLTFFTYLPMMKEPAASLVVVRTKAHCLMNSTSFIAILGRWQSQHQDCSDNCNQAAK